jgi:hypothetical protein
VPIRSERSVSVVLGKGRKGASRVAMPPPKRNISIFWIGGRYFPGVISRVRYTVLSNSSTTGRRNILP